MGKKKKEPTAETIRAVFSMMGKKGGKARAEALTPTKRKAIAKKAAAKRWEKEKI